MKRLERKREKYVERVRESNTERETARAIRRERQ